MYLETLVQKFAVCHGSSGIGAAGIAFSAEISGYLNFEPPTYRIPHRSAFISDVAGRGLWRFPLNGGSRNGAKINLGTYFKNFSPEIYPEGAHCSVALSLLNASAVSKALLPALLRRIVVPAKPAYSAPLFHDTPYAVTNVPGSRLYHDSVLPPADLVSEVEQLSSPEVNTRTVPTLVSPAIKMSGSGSPSLTESNSSGGLSTPSTTTSVDPKATKSSSLLQKAGENAYIEFPYPLLSTSTVRFYKGEESSRFQQFLGALSYLWFLLHWYICTISVPVIGHWLYTQLTQLTRWIAATTTASEKLPFPDAPSLVLFVTRLTDLCVDTVRTIALWPLTFPRVLYTCLREAFDRNFPINDMPFTHLARILRDNVSYIGTAATSDLLLHLDSSRIAVRCAHVAQRFWHFATSYIGAGGEWACAWGLKAAAVATTLGWWDQVVLAYICACIYVAWDEFYRIPRRNKRLMPQFVRTSHAHLSFFSWIGAKMYDCCAHWYKPGSAIIFEDYEKFVAAGRTAPPTVLCYHPHGIFSNLFGLLASCPELEGYRVMAAPLMKVFGPLFTLLRFGYSTLSSADKSTFTQCMVRREGMMLVPGGIQEASLTRYGQDRIWMRRRKGFIHMALRYGYSLTPVYGFGENLMYHNLGADALIGFKEQANSKGIISTLPLGFYGTPIPKRVPALVVVGEPIKLPRIEKPTSEDVDKYYQIYISTLQRLYSTYADSYYAHCKKFGIEADRSTCKRKVDVLVPPSENAPGLLNF